MNENNNNTNDISALDNSKIDNIVSVSRGELISKFKQSDKDTGSPEVQIALLTQRIEGLSSHFKLHPEDKLSKVGMLRLISNRKSLLQYLKNRSLERYKSTISALNLRK